MFKDPYAKKGAKEGGLTGYADKARGEKGAPPMFQSWDVVNKNAGKTVPSIKGKGKRGR